MKAALIFVIFVMMLLVGCCALPGAQLSQNGTQQGGTAESAGAAASSTAQAGATQPGATEGSAGGATSGAGAGTADEGQGSSGDGAGSAEETAETSGAKSPETAGAIGNTTLLLLGRSVSEGWATYMGLEWQEDGTYLGTYDGSSIRYFHVDSPPEIANSAKTAIDTYGSDIVFFKLCFVDFSTEAGEGLGENEQYVQQVYDEAVTKGHRKLIVGNALPQVSMSTTSGLKSNHKAYNQWLTQFASTHPDIEVLDLYGMLSDSNGNLKAGYAASSEDSHLNDAAYAKITPELMRLVNDSKGG